MATSHDLISGFVNKYPEAASEIPQLLKAIDTEKKEATKIVFNEDIDDFTLNDLTSLAGNVCSSLALSDAVPIIGDHVLQIMYSFFNSLESAGVALEPVSSSASDTCEYRALGLSTEHLTESDQRVLTSQALTENRVLERETGYFIKLYRDDPAKNLNTDYSKALNHIIALALKQGYQMIEFDTDIDINSNYEIHC